MSRSRLCSVLMLLALISALPLLSEGPKKVLYIDSYHQGWPWNDRIADGIRKVLDDTDINFRIHYMDTKRNTAEDFKVNAGLKAKELIDSWKPDVVIASDDNAAKYVITPYFLNTEIPFVSCGINWDASIYGFPATNVTGIVEVNLVDKMLRQLSRYTNGRRIGYLASDTYTERQDAEHYKSILGIELTEEVYVTSYPEWKKEFCRLQEGVDILIVGTPGLADFDYQGAEIFVIENTKVPTGAMNEFLMPYALMGYMKVPEEFGIWAAQSALQILNGTSPAEIPMVTNHRFELILNLRIADRLGIVFSTGLLKNAKILR
ncbi:ABC transporter substrate binding protein [Marispirochaeta aestuarii]|uniref:ABC transporter substrate-binding protein n=1 Tax=Marispirochaeta aestuarii TaxID=1963862 RepID=UPI0029C7A8F0|nr:ABC transporter substrate binding protein [Marispirochaeta aestuarii]